MDTLDEMIFVQNMGNVSISLKQFSECKDANPTQRLYFVGLRSFSADAYNEFICISTVFDTLPICPKYV